MMTDTRTTAHRLAQMAAEDLALDLRQLINHLSRDSKLSAIGTFAGGMEKRFDDMRCALRVLREETTGRETSR